VRHMAMAMAVAAVLTLGAGRADAQAADLHWFKGNTHTHTLNSDGDSVPADVATWYREHGYQFLVLTDHNYVTPVDGLNAMGASDGRFVVIAGEEITDRAAGKPVHVNVLGPATAQGDVKPQGGATPAAALAADVAAARGRGIAQVNHPNFGWALSPADLLQADGPYLLEVYNGHPQVNNAGGGGAPSAEAAWDALLSAGRIVYAAASDDLHDLKRPGIRQAAGPGRGWVVVRAARLSAADVLAALEHGDFYASTGVELRDLAVTPRSLSVSVEEQGSTRYRVQFIGRDGRVLGDREGPAAAYEFTGEEGYVRARVTDSNGWTAWTQAVRVPARAGER
jgi:hypothetical protein